MSKRRVFYYIIAVLLGLPVSLLSLVMVTLLIGLNLSYGRHLLEEKIPTLSGNMVHLKGISGSLPWDIYLQNLSISDPQGGFITCDNVHFSWSPLALFKATLKINHLSAGHILYSRAPFFPPSPRISPKTSSSFSLPLGVELEDFNIEKFDIAPKALKKDVNNAFSLSLHGGAEIATIAPFMGKITPHSLPNMRIILQIKRLDAQGELSLLLSHKQENHQDLWNGHVDYDEDKDGFATILASMPELDPLDLHLKIKGDLSSLHHHFSLHAGMLNGEMAGNIDLLKKNIESAIKISSKAVSLRPEIGWQNVTFYADFHGAFIHPYGKALCDIDGLSLKENSIGHIQFSLNAEQEDYHLLGRIDSLSLPHKPLLFGEAPLIINADFSPFNEKKNFQISLNHEILQLHFLGHLKPALQAHLSVNIPQLDILAAMGGISLQGKTDLEGDIALASEKNKKDRVDFKENISLLSGQKQAVKLIGTKAVLEGSITRDKEGIFNIAPITLHGKNIDLLLQGFFNPYKKTDKESNKTQPTKIEAHLSLTDLRDIHEALLGDMALKAHLEGFLDDLSLNTQIDSLLGVRHSNIKVQPGRLHLELAAEHLPSQPKIKLYLEGILDKSPLLMNAEFSHNDKILGHFILNNLSWKSLQGKGIFTLPVGQKLPEGEMDIKLQKLENFRNLIGQEISGGLAFSFATKLRDAHQNAAKDLAFSLLSDLKMKQYHIEGLDLKGTVTDIFKDPFLDMTFNIKNAHIKEIIGSVLASVKGSQNALSLKINGDFKHVLDAPASFNISLLENIPEKKLVIQNIWVKFKKEKIQISQPVTVNYGTEIKINRLLMTLTSPYGVQPVSLDMGGVIKPHLAFNASLTHLSPALLQDFVPSLKSEGEISANAHLLGSLESPKGEVVFSANGLHLLTEPAASLPKVSLMMKTELNGNVAHLNAALKAGSDFDCSLYGDVPLKEQGQIGLQTKGNIKLSMANAVLGTSGMGVDGVLVFDLSVGGKRAKPSLKGDIELKKGSFDHYGQGVHLRKIYAHLQALGDRLHFEKFLLLAGEGTMSLAGDIGILQPSFPLNLDFVMDKAQPLRSDMIDEVIDAHLHIQGQAATGVNIDGKIIIPNVNINILDALPNSVAQLEIIDPEKEKRKKLSSPFRVGLNIDLNSPGEFFVRGHGLFAEMQGNLHVGGSSLAPEITGGFDLRRGNFNLAGINLNFSHGHVGFNGAGVGHKLDPTLNFQADRNAAGILASLLVSGYASTPKIDFTSTPEKPKDEVLSILLFGAGRAELSTTQLAELGSAVVQLGGGKMFDPLSAVRNSLGLDHLAIGGGSSVGDGGTNIEAGKYVLKGVYVGAKEGVSGGGSQAQVKIDLTQHLKLNTVVGTGGQVTGFTTPENDPGSSIGLSYGTDY